MVRKIQQTQLTTERLSEAQIPKAFWHFQADTYSGSRKALEDCNRYAEKFAQAARSNLGLFIRGSQEVQKTFLATYVLRYLMTQGHDVLYVSFPDLVDRILRNETTLREFLTAYDCVVLDNVNEPGNSFWPTALNRALVLRKDEGKPTIVVTQLARNANSDAFGALYGENNLRMIEHLSHTIYAEMDDAQKHKAEMKRKELFTEVV